jgi:hypothetical protein
MKVRFHPLAKRELIAAALYLVQSMLVFCRSGMPRRTAKIGIHALDLPPPSTRTHAGGHAVGTS